MAFSANLFRPSSQNAGRSIRQFLAQCAIMGHGIARSPSVTVVVPETASAHARSLIRQDGAEIIVHGASWQEANALAESMLGTHDAFLHPFDDPLVWQGHSSMIDEVVLSAVRPDAVVLSVGGGGAPRDPCRHYQHRDLIGSDAGVRAGVPLVHATPGEKRSGH
jgi:hypothetical protein